MKKLFPKVHVIGNNLIKKTVLKNSGVTVTSFENNRLMSCICFGFQNTGIRYEIDNKMNKMNKTKGFGKVLCEITFQGSKEYEYDEYFNNKWFFESEIDMENIQYFGQFYRENINDVCSLFVDGVFQPMIDNEELIEKCLNNVEMKVNECFMNPSNVLKSPYEDTLMDRIKQSCFSNKQSLGYPLMYSNKDSFDINDFKEYFQNNIRLDNLVVTGIGVDHDEFVELIEQNLKNIPALKENTVDVVFENNIWKGEEYREEFLDKPKDVEMQNIPSLSSLTCSVPASGFRSEDSFSWFVLESLLGGGDSFSQGGPGKGLSSVIYEKFLGYYPFFNMESRYTGFSEIGIFSVHASCEHEYAQYLGDAIYQLYHCVADEFTENSIQAAKNRFKADMLRHLENGQFLTQVINSDFLHFDEFRTSSKYIKDNIDSVTKDDLLRIWSESLSYKPAVTCIGDTNKIPTKEKFDEAFSKLNV